MSVKTTFKRYEFKYILTKEQYNKLLYVINNYMKRDDYGKHRISNIYFDTADYKIIRHSLEKPKYKEKLRARIYGQPSEDKTVFIELKKKFNGVVYKRRITAPMKEAMNYMFEGKELEKKSQILSEINYFRSLYSDLIPKVYLAYDREAYFSEDDDNFRITFDSNIKMRDIKINFNESKEDNIILKDGQRILEVKTSMGLPTWLLEFFTENKVYKTSFSKYGTAYTDFILKDKLEYFRGA